MSHYKKKDFVVILSEIITEAVSESLQKKYDFVVILSEIITEAVSESLQKKYDFVVILSQRLLHLPTLGCTCSCDLFQRS